MTGAELLALGGRWLRHSRSPRLDAEVLLAHALNRERSFVLTHSNEPIRLSAALRYLWLALRARAGVPIAYLVGKREFYGRRFIVTPAILVPRPESELLVEQALGTIRANGSITRVADIGTGSGCIAITLALELPRLMVYASDASAAALKVAGRNAEQYGASERLRLLHGNLLEPFIKHKLLTSTTLVVANLPYLRPAEYKGGLRFEPRGALVGGPDGLSLYREFLEELKGLTSTERPRWVILELHPPTAHEVEHLVKNVFPESQATVLPDLAGLPRILTLSLA